MSTYTLVTKKGWDLWNFVRKNKGKLSIAVGVAGMCYIFVKNQLSSFETAFSDNIPGSSLSDAHKKELHFEDTQKKCDSTILTLNSKILDSLDCFFKIDEILKTLKSGYGDKLALWQKLGTLVFTRIISEIYIICSFVCFMKVQLNVLSGYLYYENCSSANIPSSFTNQIQLKYLSLLNNFYEKGFEEFIEPIQQAVTEVLSEINFKENFGYQDIVVVFEKIKSLIKNIFLSQSNLSKFLISSYQLESSLQAAFSDPNKASIFDQVIIETQDILETPDFKNVLEACIDTGYSVKLDMVLGVFQSSLKKDDNFSNPNLIKANFAKLIPAFKNACSKREDTLARSLLYLEPLNCFAANTYETFTVPKKTY